MAARNKRQRCKRLEKRFHDGIKAVFTDHSISTTVAANKVNLVLQRAKRFGCRWVDDL